MLRHFTVFVAALALAGCTGATDGSPEPDRGRESSGDYRSALPDDERAQLEYFDSIRAMDPCALLADSAIDAIGTPSLFGPGLSTAECAVRFDPSAGPKSIARIDASIEAGAISTDGAEPRSIVGRDALVHTLTSGTCVGYVPIEDVATVHYSMSRVGDGDVCPELIDVMTASLPALDSKPPRESSRHWQPTTLDRVDPCAVIGALGVGDDPYVNGAIATCDFALDGGSTGSRISITNKYDPTFVYSNPSAVALEISGVPAVEAESGESCSIDLGVGHDRPLGSPDPDNDSERIEAVLLRAPSCDEAREVAVEVVRRYAEERQR